MVLKKGFITGRKPKLKKLTCGGDSGAMRNLYSKIFCVGVTQCGSAKA